MNSNFETLRIENIIGSRRFSNYCWAIILFIGAFGFLIVGLSSYIKQDLVPFLSSKNIIFTPQGIVMCFYGIAGLFVSLYIWCTIWFNIGSGYNEFDKKRAIVRIFRWGFPGKNRRISIQCAFEDIQAIRLEIKESIYPRCMLYIKIKGQKDVPLTQIGETLTLREIEDKAADLARFLKVSIEGL
uniref:Photosystem I assembly protein Ycf4 n=1 Tax=Coleochaete scutata TaxID=3125 RepID=A0A191T5P0_COLSC|nr:hypothetical chloroplast RF4 [Coleochaete scutata]ANI25721.1 hypothetical chloroplast RF4 [Coleochaete scutata]